MKSIDERTKAQVARVLGIEPGDILGHHTLVDDLGADDIDLYELAMFAEEEFGITVSDEEIVTATTVDSLIEMVKRKQGK